MPNIFRSILALFAVIALTGPRTLRGQTTVGCDQPSNSSGLILGRALRDESYKDKRAFLGIDNIDRSHIRALTDPDAAPTCDALRRMLMRAPGRAANTELHFFSDGNVYFVTVEQIRRNAQETEASQPQLFVVQGRRVGRMFVGRE